FRASMTQTDVLESGRIFTDMSIREIGQMAPSGLYSTTNFFAELSPFFSVPLLQGLPGTTRGPGTEDRRTNLVERMFFLNLVNQTWTGTGYEVLPDYANAGVGTLYRFSVSTNGYRVSQLSSNFLTGVRFAAANLGQGKPVTNLN